jgi:hypothetical protein
VLISFLRANRDIFAWKPADMPGVPRELIEHSLNVDPKATPKRQHLRRFADDRRDAIKKELAKLLAAGFIREVFHPEWLANPILVRRKNSNEWRMCVDYTDLNKHCPKDPFGLPWIDQVIDSTRELQPALLPRLLLRVPPDRNQGERPGEDRVHHPVWCVLLHDHVIQVEERRCYLPTGHPGLLQAVTQQERRGLCG